MDLVHVIWTSLSENFWVVLIAYIILSWHNTSLASSLYLHRSLTHNSVEFAAPISYWFRFWLWLNTGMNKREWVGVHRQHHLHADEEGDPHSPVLTSIGYVMRNGVWMYRAAAKDKAMIAARTTDMRDDWLETNFFLRFRSAGIFVLMLLNILFLVILQGPDFWPVAFNKWSVWMIPLEGFGIWVLQVLWMIFIGHVINGWGHGVGYKNKKDLKDSSTNIIPVGLLVVGEELHNNHHAHAASPKFSQKWYEFDFGWLVIVILSWFRLAKVKSQKIRVKKDIVWCWNKLLELVGLKKLANPAVK